MSTIGIILTIIAIAVVVMLFIGYHILKTVSPNIFEVFKDPSGKDIPIDREERHKN